MIINNYSQNYKQPTFKQLGFKNLNGLKAFNEIHCKTTKNNNYKKVNDYFLRIENDYTPDEFYINIDDEAFNQIGQSKITLRKNTIYNDSIDILRSKSKKSGAGSIMRLGQIITMLENDFDRIELYSLGQAVLFHSKFKFEPNIQKQEELNAHLQTYIIPLITDKRFEKIAKEAAEYLNDKSLPKEKALEIGNKILYKYLQTINKYKLNLDENFQIDLGFNMILTKDKVIKHKDFFNQLFNKYGIDYQIND